jgi:hypothetical protein
MSSRRGSIGGSILRDSSSRYNSSISSSSRRRQSFGGGGGGGDNELSTTPHKPRGLLDSSSSVLSGLRDEPSARTTRSTSLPRRESFGGDNLRSETPVKDRRAMLAAWRVAKTGNREPNETDVDTTKKRNRGYEAPPLPPTDYHQSRKQQKVQQHMHLDGGDEPLPLSQNSAVSQSIQYYDDETTGDFSRAGSSLLSARTPSSRRRGLLGAARRKSFAPRSMVQPAEGMCSKSQ